MKAIAFLGCAITAVVLLAFSDKEQIKLPKRFKQHYAFVPAGTVHMDGMVHGVEGFYLCKHEVTNEEYKEFLWYISRERPDLMDKVAVDTSAWNHFSFDVFSNAYFQHPAFNNFPVVNISHDAAQFYCAWLTEFNRDKGLFANMGNVKVTYRLPTREEWVKAANGHGADRTFAWGHDHVRDTRGVFLANFQAVPEVRIRYDIESKNYEIIPYNPEYSEQDSRVNDKLNWSITAPARLYPASDLGLWHMNGNVAEMLAEPGIAAGGSWLHTAYDIRNQSIMHFDGPSPLVGFRVLAVVEIL